MLKLSIGDVMNLHCFYEELFVMGRGRVIDLDLENKTIAWEVDEKILKATFIEKRVFFKNSNKWVGADIVFKDGNFISAKVLNAVYEPRLRRNFVRVTTSLSEPVKVLVVDPFSERKKGEFWASDISEGGVGLVTDKKRVPLKVGNNYVLLISLSIDKITYRIVTKAKLVHFTEVDNKLKKLGMLFIDLERKYRDLIYRYVVKRQKDIIRALKF